MLSKVNLSKKDRNTLYPCWTSPAYRHYGILTKTMHAATYSTLRTGLTWAVFQLWLTPPAGTPINYLKLKCNTENIKTRKVELLEIYQARLQYNGAL